MLKEMPKMNDKIRYIGDTNSGFKYGDVFEISGMSFGEATFRDGEDNRMWIVEERFPFWELVVEPEPAPSVADILANLALRVSELESESVSNKASLLAVEKRVDSIIGTLGWKRMGAGRIPELESKVIDVRHDVQRLFDKLDEISEVIAND